MDSGFTIGEDEEPNHLPREEPRQMAPIHCGQNTQRSCKHARLSPDWWAQLRITDSHECHQKLKCFEIMAENGFLLHVIVTDNQELPFQKTASQSQPEDN